MCWFARELVIETDMELKTGMSWRRFKECYKENECVSLPCSPGMCMLLMTEFVPCLLEEDYTVVLGLKSEFSALP